MGFVYIFEDTDKGIYKVGMTKRNPQVRIKEAQTFNAKNLRLVDFFESDYYKEIEKFLHVSYKRFHINREWFSLDLETVCNFKKLCERLQISFANLNN